MNDNDIDTAPTAPLTSEEANPLRTFIVANAYGEQEFRAHFPKFSGDILELMTMVGDVAWTTYVFAKGHWSRVYVVPPTPDQVEKMGRYEMEHQVRVRKEAIELQRQEQQDAAYARQGAAGKSRLN